MSHKKAIVVGCGVSGLSCAIRLLEAGLKVELWTRDLPAKTTSTVAAAIWYAFKVSPPEKVARWARITYNEFDKLARNNTPGVTMHRGLELVADGVVDMGEHIRVCCRGLQQLPRAEVPSGFAAAYAMEVPVAEMPIYLDWMLARFEQLGGRLVERRIADLAEPLAQCALVVNCTGLASRELCHDGEVRAIRGQIVRVEKSGVDTFVLDDYDPRGLTYVIPRSKDCVLGGTVELEREDLVPEESSTNAILARCISVEPRLKKARVLSVAVGLRPGRSAVRVELEKRGNATLIHDYGHGGAGITLSWGCADDVTALAMSADAS